jgi:hypothetical protein
MLPEHFIKPEYKPKKEYTMKLSNQKSPKSNQLDSLINFEVYTKDEEGLNQFYIDIRNLFRVQNQAMRDRINLAGGYKAIFNKADKYFEMEESTVQYVTTNFFKITSLVDDQSAKVEGDDIGHRFKIFDRYNHDFKSFQFASDFIMRFISYLIIRHCADEYKTN